MYTPEQRHRLRCQLLERAAEDKRISGVALTGSAAENKEDAWSDIDLAFGVGAASELPEVISDWTAYLYDQHSALHHLDVMAGSWIYRVFLLRSSLQVDLAFVSETEFRALAPTFRLVSGKANAAQHAPPPQPANIIGFAWLYALHARSCIARGNYWQAEYMISGVRDQALALACIRHGLPAAYGKGIDRLPPEVTAPFEDSLVRSLEGPELSRALRAGITGLLAEIRNADAELSERLQDTVAQLCE